MSQEKYPRAQLNRLLKREELKWRQRCNDKEIMEGDGNTRYFSCKSKWET
jgi:hypothetical protein